jgi:hypothetical protein
VVACGGIMGASLAAIARRVGPPAASPRVYAEATPARRAGAPVGVDVRTTGGV